MAVSEELRRKREELVIEHMESENRHEYDATIETFDHPRYELVGTGDVFDGPEEVARYFEETRTAFPDQRNELIALHHADDAVIVEANLLRDAPGLAPRPAADRTQVRDAVLRRVRVRGGPPGLRARVLRLRTRSFASSASPTTLRP